MKKRLTLQQENEVCFRYNNGESCSEISRSLDVNTTTIERALTRHDIPKRKLSKLSATETTGVRIRYLAGDSTKDIARDIGVHPTTVLRSLRRSKTERRKAAPPNKLNPAQISDICQRYLTGENIAQLARLFSVSCNCIAVSLKKNNLVVRPYHKLSALRVEERNKIIQSYTQGQSTTDIALQLSVHPCSVGRFLNRYKIPTRHKGFEYPDSWRQKISKSHRIYKCNFSFFDKIVCEAQAYWLGFLAADGCIHRGAVHINISSQDREHLIRFLTALQSEHPIKDIVQDNSRLRSSKPSPMSRICIRSLELTRALEKHGVHPRKASTLQWPDFLPDDILRHYLRGVFDGDGSFSRILRKEHPRWTPTIRFSIASNQKFLEEAQRFLMDTCDLNRTKIAKHTNGRATYQLTYAGNRQVKRIFHLLYHKATIFLPRKFWKAFPILYPSHPAVLRRQQRETAP